MELSEDLFETCESKLKFAFKEHNENLQNNEELWKLHEVMLSEVEISKANENLVQRKLDELLCSENVDIITKYASLKGLNEKLQEENRKLRDILDNLEIQITAEKEAVRKDYIMKQKDYEEKHNYEIKILKQQIENNKQNYEQEIKKLYNELQVAEATSTLQRDEIETELKRKLFDLSSKLRDSQNQCSIMQMELQNLKKQRYKPQINLDNQNVTPTKHVTIDFQENHPRPLSNISTETTEINFELSNSRYPQLNVTSDKTTDNQSNILKPQMAPPLYKGGGVAKRINNSGPPALKPCSKSKPNVQRKRKLYNPDDLDYLKEYENN